ncbi:MAG: protein translocase subunit SecD [Alphaproteobacteria bacterium]
MVHFTRWKKILILGICFFGILIALPNVLSTTFLAKMPSFLPHQTVNLGLDLQGGSHLLLEVDLRDIEKERLDMLQDEIRSTFRRKKIDGKKVNLRKLRKSGDHLVFNLGEEERSFIKEVRKKVKRISEELEVSENDGKISIKYTTEAKRQYIDHVIQQSLEIVRRRIDETGTREPNIQRQGYNRILVQLPGLDNPDRVKSLLGQTAKMTFHVVDDDAVSAVTGRVKPGYERLPLLDAAPGRPATTIINKRIMVNGDNLIDSQPTFQQGEPVVSMRFDSIGTKRFADASKKYVQRQFAIVLDGKVLSAPVIREPILTGNGVISGNFTIEGAKDLSLLLRAGALPAPLNVIEERTVGPGLGADSVEAGKFASILALSLVLVFMLFAYRLFGIFANISLLINVTLLFAALSFLQATLTLPGIAGIVLTIGMAVDANVLVFQRIREEVKKGRTPISAIDIGYRQALVAILDANTTTFLCTLLLYIFGSGPVKGFAVTLIIGIITSLFSGIMVTRLLVVTWLKKTDPQELKI